MTLAYEHRVLSLLAETPAIYYRVHLVTAKRRRATLSPYLTREETRAVCHVIERQRGRVIGVQTVQTTATPIPRA